MAERRILLISTPLESFFDAGMSLKAILSPHIFLFLVLISPLMVSICSGSEFGHDETMRPMGGIMVLNTTRRRLGSFQVCGLCTCCGGPRNLCIPSSCCYAINCNLPNRPFGVCALTPRSCSCIGCTF